MTHEQRMEAVNLAKPFKAAREVFAAVVAGQVSLTEFSELLPLIDNECACEICGGTKGGTPGNENIIDGICVCDFCTNEYRVQEGTMLKQNKILMFRNGGTDFVGAPDGLNNSGGLWGDCSKLRGDACGITGDCTGLQGDCTGLVGDCTWVKGDCNHLTGACTNLTGDFSQLSGELSHLKGQIFPSLWGHCTGLKGNVTGVMGRCTGVVGDLDNSGIMENMRKEGITLDELVKA